MSFKLPIHPNEILTPKVVEKTSVKIVSLMRENKNITIAEISVAIGKTTRAIEMQIARLKEKRYRRANGARYGWFLGS